MAKQRSISGADGVAPSTLKTLEDKIEIAKKVCYLYASQNATLESCCNGADISVKTFWLWRVEFPEIAELFKNATVQRDEVYWERLKPKAQTALEKLLEGGKRTEKKQETGIGPQGAIDKTTEAEVEYLPNPTVTIFAMKGYHPERFVDHTKLSGAVETGPGLDYSKLTPEEKRVLLQLFEKAKKE